jgi:hypothetical protein
MQFSGQDVTSIGIHYGPSSVCIGIPGGRLERVGTGRIFTLDITCMASTCKSDGLYIVLKDVTGDKYSEFKCPAGGFVDLGASAGYPPGVCPLPLSFVLLHGRHVYRIEGRCGAFGASPGGNHC